MTHKSRAKISIHMTSLWFRRIILMELTIRGMSKRIQLTNFTVKTTHMAKRQHLLAVRRHKLETKRCRLKVTVQQATSGLRLSSITTTRQLMQMLLMLRMPLKKHQISSQAKRKRAKLQVLDSQLKTCQVINQRTKGSTVGQLIPKIHHAKATNHHLSAS